MTVWILIILFTVSGVTSLRVKGSKWETVFFVIMIGSLTALGLYAMNVAAPLGRL